MCGIAGCFISGAISKEIVDKTLNSMRNRGPDNQNVIK